MSAAVVFALNPLNTMAEEVTQEELDTDGNVEEIKIVGMRQNRVSQGATGLSLEISETPQSISVVSQEQIQKFAANSINDALKLAPGIAVEEWETNRTNYTARGYEIKNTQIDGVGLPNNWGIVTGAIDSYGYEKIEVIRGANGLLTGVGNASGTINYVRKRPKNENTGEVSVSAGSYNFMRAQADVSVVLTDDDKWAGRFVAAVEDKESYLNGLENDRQFIYAVVDGQISDYATIAAGYSYQDANTDGNTWGGLVFNYDDGSQAEWDTSDSTTQEWTYWDTTIEQAFVELNYIFANSWQLQASYNKRNSTEDDKLFYAYGAINKDTGLGLQGWPGRFGGKLESDLVELKLRGVADMFGLDHEFNLGASAAKSTDVLHQYAFDSATTPALGPTPAFPYALDAIPEPEWGDKFVYSEIDQTLFRFYGSAKISFTENLFTVVGFNAIAYERSGNNSGAEIDNDESEISPYAALTYAITDDVRTYISYSDVYQPQEQYSIDRQFLAPTKGENYETGVKIELFDDRLLFTAAYFIAEQNNLAAYGGTDENFQYWYYGVDVESKGVELELVGKVTDDLNVSIGYAKIDVEDMQGNDANTWAPRDSVNFSVDYTLLSTLTLGLGGRWQSEVSNVDYNVSQGSYLLLNGFVQWQITEALSAKANINNITDEKYITSLHTIGYYAAPANGSVTVSYSF
ncbi:TonB-dependent siderophore receptor [Catenovulum sp. SX2]|uniref:TonB-dependent siderophore receptor n=1 Tax=Catenovulum sp. SX2 TaxID=3398614 RepID=UPI003F8638F8